MAASPRKFWWRRYEAVKELLCQACSSLGYGHDPEKLFKCLLGTPGAA